MLRIHQLSTSAALLLFSFFLISNRLYAKEKPIPAGELLTMDYLVKNSFAEALLQYKQVEDSLRQNPSNAKALWRMGLIYFIIAVRDKNYLPKCLEAWDNYLQYYPNDPFALWNRSFVKNYFKTGDACADLKSALLILKKKHLPKEPEELWNCLKKTKK
ncbi:MAG: hypothetical protein RMJ53_02130 [Chitinophagales bacterium]|nr:hypothetical protein [Chitinophagales bacterium]MDW8273008.1 hypothetical protein [Chitinophagales bacterium]